MITYIYNNYDLWGIQHDRTIELLMRFISYIYDSNLWLWGLILYGTILFSFRTTQKWKSLCVHVPSPTSIYQHPAFLKCGPWDCSVPLWLWLQWLQVSSHLVSSPLWRSRLNILSLCPAWEKGQIQHASGSGQQSTARLSQSFPYIQVDQDSDPRSKKVNSG